jgi:DNA-binding GntR family transcriptional regulator
VTPDIERNSAVAIYEQIADQLRDQIQGGELKPGQRLPTEPELMRSCGVSRSTVRVALNVLEDEGLLTRRAGKGTFVAHRELAQDLSNLRSFPEAMAAQGFTVQLRPVAWDIAIPPAPVRKQLGLANGEKVLRIERVHWLDEETVATDSLSLPAWITDRVSVERLLTTSTYQVLEEEAGIPLGAASQRVSATTAGRDCAKLLSINPHDPVLLIERLTYALSGVPIEYLNLRYRADKVVLNVHLPRHSLPLVFEPAVNRQGTR